MSCGEWFQHKKDGWDRAIGNKKHRKPIIAMHKIEFKVKQNNTPTKQYLNHILIPGTDATHIVQ